jgi:hypothetical protein
VVPPTAGEPGGVDGPVEVDLFAGVRAAP